MSLVHASAEEPLEEAGGQAEGAGETARSTLARAKADEIKSRIAELQKSQAELRKKVAAGEIDPHSDLRAKWPELTKNLTSVREQITALNALEADSPDRPALETKILTALQPIGLHLPGATHPPLEARVLDENQRAEMERIGKAIENLTFGDRKKARPVEFITPTFEYTLLHLPVPVIMKSKPGEKIYLVAMTGGVFANGLSLIELQTNESGYARTSWVSHGDAVGPCHISVYSQVAIERQQLELEVVSPSLTVIEGLPRPDEALLSAPDLIKRRIPLKR